MTQPLENIRVIDLTQVLAGPFCTRQLAVMGAEVIRIEAPWGGHGTGVMRDQAMDIRRRFDGTNFANKKNITLNLRSERGKELFLKLVKKADVVVQNFSPGTMEKLGLSYEVLKGVNPGVIYCAISGYGQTGPWKDKVAYDVFVQASTGFMSVNGYPDREPVKVGPSLSDMLAGLYAAVGILTALHARDTITGEGQMIDCAMFDAALALLSEPVAWSLFEGEPMPRYGNRHPMGVPSGIYTTKDGKSEFIGCLTDAQWNTLMSVIGRPDIVEREWAIAERWRHVDEIDDIVGMWARTKTQDEIERVLTEHDAPCAPVLNLVEVEKHPHTRAREMLLEIDDMFGRITGMLGIVPKLLGTPGRLDYGLMERGAFNAEIYAGLLGLSEEEMDKYKEEGTI